MSISIIQRAEENPDANWHDVIMDIGERTLDVVGKYKFSILTYLMTRKDRVVNRIWCKALVRYLRMNKKWMAVEGNVERLKKLENFTQVLRSYVARSKIGSSNTRGPKMHDNLIEGLKFANDGNMGWTDPYRILRSIIFNNDVIAHVIGTDSFRIDQDVVEALTRTHEEEKLARRKRWEAELLKIFPFTVK